MHGEAGLTGAPLGSLLWHNPRNSRRPAMRALVGSLVRSGACRRRTRRANAERTRHLRRGRRGRKRDAVCVAWRRFGAHRLRQSGAGRGERRGPDHGRGPGRRAHADRQPDHDALARRSFRRHGRTRVAHPDSQFHRPRRQRAAGPGRGRLPPEGVSAALREVEAHGRRSPATRSPWRGSTGAS